ncbi:unnamed protein product [Rotaria sp. Silwood1]|nr:unnamed protein product [Rotaria sp. Silwood1]CAF3367509.1 unnamed protein product [Rotaria sp. Silwood1]CAF3398369.1 unnamed protein product [Rotaria sp. Silwood1]CAF4686602.1 unnamed protein product [Rotaria sp. Silwood1]CAF4772588.1 unnamed protein product [Rotaria sp. Silwood1]
MPIVEQSSVHHHHHHGHGHQTFYHEQHIPEETSKIQLTLILPNGVPSIINVDANTPMMDLLVQAASLNKLNPSSYSLVVLDSNQHVIHFKANQTVGQIGSSTISLLPKESTHSNSSSKPKAQPFEITVRLQVNLPDAQKILLRIDPILPLYEIKEQICKQKKYTNSNQYTLRLPNKLDQPLLLGLSLAEYKTNELTLIHNKDFEFEQQFNTNQIQTFDRLYRIRSESQPPRENFQYIQQQQQQQQNEQQLINTKQINRSNTNRSSTLRPSHTALHAYWNDPNFDTQSQLSNCSSIVKKRPAPRPPGSMNSKRPDSQIIYIQQQEQTSNNIHLHSLPFHIEHHQSHESLQSENTKKKRKAPIVASINSVQTKDEIDQIEQKQNLTNNITRPGLDPPPPPSMTNIISTSANNLHEDLHPTIEINQKSIDEPEKNDVTINHINENQSVLDLIQNETSKTDTSVITTNFLEPINIEIHPPSPIHSPEQIQTESPIIQQQEEKFEQKEISINIPSMIETNINKSSILKPPRQNIYKEKKSSTIDGLLRIVNDHNERSNIYQKNENKQIETNENVSYFRVAKSRYGKFETDNRGFVNNSIAIFDSTNQQKLEKKINKNTHSSELLTNSKQFKTISSNIVQHQTKGKQAYNLLKKYEKEAQSQSINNPDYLKTINQQEKSSMPVQLQHTERTAHITVSIENDRKQLITRTPSVSQESSPPLAPPIPAPKPFGKAITEYRAVRGIGTNDEMIAPMRNRITSATDINNKRSTSFDSNKRLSTNLAASYEALMESIRQFGGSQNLRKT